MQACKVSMGWLSWQGRAVSGVGREGSGKGRKGVANVYTSFLPFPVPVRAFCSCVSGLAVGKGCGCAFGVV
jgi:hypothetical protein